MCPLCVHPPFLGRGAGVIGVVQDWFGPSTPWGRILGEDGVVYFVHRSALRGVQALTPGQSVEFVEAVTVRGPRAESVRLIVPVPVHAVDKEG
jgi:cold shock CspA family protein